MKKTLVLLIMIVIFFTGCKNIGKTKAANKNKLGTITNPYQGDESQEIDLTCENPKIGKNCKIKIHLRSLWFEDDFNVDMYHLKCFVTLLDHENDFPIDLGDYISVVYYDEKNKKAGDKKYKFHYSETSDEVGLVFEDGITEGWLDHTLTDEEVNNAKVDKVAIQYYRSGKKKQVFFSLAPRIGTCENPIQMDKYGLDHTIYQEKEQVDLGIFSCIGQSKDGYTAKMSIKYYGSYDPVKERRFYGKSIDISKYITISFYDTKGVIGKHEYQIENENGVSCEVNERDEITVKAHIPKKDLKKRIPTKVCLNFNSYGKDRQLFINLDSIG